jgi:hypothetical protein
MKTMALVLGTLLAMSGAGIAEAGSGYRGGGGHHGHSGSGHRHYYRPYYSRVFVTTPFYAYPGYYYPPPAYYAPAAAPIYVEQPAPAAAPLPPGDWYYCAPARAYYPDVPTCAESWQRVAPRQ